MYIAILCFKEDLLKLLTSIADFFYTFVFLSRYYIFVQFQFK